MGEFSNGLCGCFNNCTLCLITYVAPCYTAGKNAEAVGDSCIMVAVLYWLVNPAGVYFAAKTRQKIREQKGIDVSFFLKKQKKKFLLCMLMRKVAVNKNSIGYLILKAKHEHFLISYQI